MLSLHRSKQSTQVTDQDDQILLEINNLSLVRSGHRILNNFAMTLPQRGITSIIGPSGAGKSSLLRCINGLNNDWSGQIHIAGANTKRWPDGEDALRRQVGLISQKPTVFPCSIADNVIFGIRGKQRRQEQTKLIQSCLEKAALWDEVHHRLKDRAETLSIGQQQRLCIARALAVKPSLLLLDEPTASLDPRSKNKIEASLKQLAEKMPIVIVTHDLDQLERLAGHAVFMCDGNLIEQGLCKDLLNQPQRVETREFFQWSVCDCPPDGD